MGIRKIHALVQSEEILPNVFPSQRLLRWRDRDIYDSQEGQTLLNQSYDFIMGKCLAPDMEENLRLSTACEV